MIIATANANIGMGGPAMIEGGGLGVVAPEAIGPMGVQVAERRGGPGVADEAAAAALRQYLGYLSGRRRWERGGPDALRGVDPDTRARVRHAGGNGGWPTRSVLELRRASAPGMITALVRVEGRAMGLIANDPAHLGGAIEARRGGQGGALYAVVRRIRPAHRGV